MLIGTFERAGKTTSRRGSGLVAEIVGDYRRCSGL
jgi:hypothetical protein